MPYPPPNKAVFCTFTTFGFKFCVLFLDQQFESCLNRLLAMVSGNPLQATIFFWGGAYAQFIQLAFFFFGPAPPLLLCFVY